MLSLKAANLADAGNSPCWYIEIEFHIVEIWALSTNVCFCWRRWNHSLLRRQWSQSVCNLTGDSNRSVNTFGGPRKKNRPYLSAKKLNNKNILLLKAMFTSLNGGDAQCQSERCHVKVLLANVVSVCVFVSIKTNSSSSADFTNLCECLDN